MNLNWISTKDRLPECPLAGMSEEIILYVPSLGVVSGMHYWDKDKIFMDDFDTVVLLDEVTHWMPLPPEPEAE